MTNTTSKLGRSFTYGAAAVALVGVGVAIGLAWPRGEASGPAVAEKSGDVLYWYDPMYPEQHFNAPGKSPYMNMDLLPRMRGDTAAASGVRIDPGVTQNLGIRTASVETGKLAPAMATSGVVSFNERDVAIVQAKVGGIVVRTYRRAPGDVVAAGDPLVDLRAPEWTAALADYLALRDDPQLAAAARQRLQILGVPASAIADAESGKAAPASFTVRTPIGGAITQLDARDGMTLSPGASIASINAISPVWLVASVPQGLAAGLDRGDAAKARLSAFPDQTFNGKIDAILPAASATSRAVEVRIALPNPGGKMRPGMTAEVTFSAAEPKASLTVPSESVIRTGQRTLVIAVMTDGSYAPVNVETGVVADGRTEIRSGLSEGQKVVSSGQFLVDSEASLAGVLTRLGAAPKATASGMHAGHGRITAIDAAGVTFAHGPIESMGWPAMTMTFAWSKDGPVKGLQVGQEADFTFRADGQTYTLETLKTGGRQ